MKIPNMKKACQMGTTNGGRYDEVGWQIREGLSGRRQNFKKRQTGLVNT
jgi:hypothetical protein